MSAITVAEFNTLLQKVPLATHMNISAVHIRKGDVRILMPYGPHLIRPGDTICGPAMMTLADVAVWANIMSFIGPQEMMVTTNLNMNFLRMPGLSDIIAEARTLKMGRRLAVAAVEIIAANTDEMVAHATVTFALPQ